MESTDEDNFAQVPLFIGMKKSLNIDDDLLAAARRVTGIEKTSALVRAGLEALITRDATRRLAALGGSEPSLRAPRRRRELRARH